MIVLSNNVDGTVFFRNTIDLLAQLLDVVFEAIIIDRMQMRFAG